MIDAKLLTEMLNDGRAVLNGDVVSVKLRDMAVEWAKPPKPQTVGEKIAEYFTDLTPEDRGTLRASIDKAIADEREANAKIAEGYCASSSSAAAYISAAIRARKT